MCLRSGRRLTAGSSLNLITSANYHSPTQNLSGVNRVNIVNRINIKINSYFHNANFMEVKQQKPPKTMNYELTEFPEQAEEKAQKILKELTGSRGTKSAVGRYYLVPKLKEKTPKCFVKMIPKELQTEEERFAVLCVRYEDRLTVIEEQAAALTIYGNYTIKPAKLLTPQQAQTAEGLKTIFDWQQQYALRRKSFDKTLQDIKDYYKKGEVSYNALDKSPAFLWHELGVLAIEQLNGKAGTSLEEFMQISAPQRLDTLQLYGTKKTQGELQDIERANRESFYNEYKISCAMDYAAYTLCATEDYKSIENIKPADFNLLDKYEYIATESSYKDTFVESALSFYSHNFMYAPAVVAAITGAPAEQCFLACNYPLGTAAQIRRIIHEK